MRALLLQVRAAIGERSIWVGAMITDEMWVAACTVTHALFFLKNFRPSAKASPNMSISRAAITLRIPNPEPSRRGVYYTGNSLCMLTHVSCILRNVRFPMCAREAPKCLDVPVGLMPLFNTRAVKSKCFYFRQMTALELTNSVGVVHQHRLRMSISDPP